MNEYIKREQVLEHAIRAREIELYAMWFENHAVLKQRDALGMACSGTKTKGTER